MFTFVFGLGCVFEMYVVMTLCQKKHTNWLIPPSVTTCNLQMAKKRKKKKFTIYKNKLNQSPELLGDISQKPMFAVPPENKTPINGPMIEPGLSFCLIVLQFGLFFVCFFFVCFLHGYFLFIVV